MLAEREESMVRYVLVEALEAVINLALSHDAGALKAIRPFAGQTIYIRVSNPDISFYVTVCDGALQLFTEHEGPVAGRLRVPALVLARCVLGAANENWVDNEDIVMEGDAVTLSGLLDVAGNFRIPVLVSGILREWLPDFEGIDDLFSAIRSQDADWMARLEHLPQLANTMMHEIRAQADISRTLVEEVREIRKQWDADRRTGQVSTIIGFCLIITAFLAHNGYLKLPVIYGLSFETVVLLVVAMVLLIPKMIRRR